MFKRNFDEILGVIVITLALAAVSTAAYSNAKNTPMAKEGIKSLVR